MKKGIKLSHGVYTLQKLTKSHGTNNHNSPFAEWNGCGCDHGNCVCD